jgi:hypothetical protein
MRIRTIAMAGLAAAAAAYLFDPIAGSARRSRIRGKIAAFTRRRAMPGEMPPLPVNVVSAPTMEAVADTPREPMKAEVGDTPREPMKAEVADTPQEPAKAEVADTPREPMTAEVADTPQEPAKVEVADTPRAPMKAEVADTPQEPTNLEGADTPQEPTKVEVADTPREPMTAEVADRPQEPAKAEVSDTSPEPMKAEVSDTPQEPTKEAAAATREDRSESDDAIASRIRMRMQGRSDLETGNLLIDVVRGVAFLRGELGDRQEIEKIVDLTGSVPGVRGVQNLIVIKLPQSQTIARPLGDAWNG